MKKIKTVAVLSISLAFCFITPAKAQAPIAHKQIKISDSVFALHQTKLYAKKILGANKISTENYACLVKLWRNESHWNPKADNPKSTAFGIGQLLNETSNDSAKQIRNGIRYIIYRYGTPCKAWQFWQRHFWY